MLHTILMPAQMEPVLEKLRDGFAGQGIDTSWLPAGPIVGYALMALGLILLIPIVRRAIRADRQRFGPTQRRFMRQLGLGPAQRLLLAEVARHVNISHAASLLVSAGCFDDAAERYANSHGHAAVSDLAEIRRRVFEQ